MIREGFVAVNEEISLLEEIGIKINRQKTKIENLILIQNGE